MNYGYDYGYTNESVVDAMDSMTGIATAMAGLGAAITIFSLIIGLISIISYAKIFKKAGKPWWASLVPIYNIIVMIEIAKLPMWYIVLLLLPIANIFALFKINIEMSKRFGKSTGFGVGMTLVSIIFIPLLAFSDNTYEGFEETTINNTNQQFDAVNVINSAVENTETTNVINEIPVAPIEVDNLSTEPIVEPANVANTPVENVEPMNTLNAEPIVEPVNVANTPVENVEPMNAFNAEPVVEPVNVANTPVENVEPMNAFNAEPIVEPVNVASSPVENIATIEPLNIETNNVADINLSQVNVVEDTTKKCKNCGNELPDIVSICPNCGTDNE